MAPKHKPEDLCQLDGVPVTDVEAHIAQFAVLIDHALPHGTRLRFSVVAEVAELRFVSVKDPLEHALIRKHALRPIEVTLEGLDDEVE